MDYLLVKKKKKHYDCVCGLTADVRATVQDEVHTIFDCAYPGICHLRAQFSYLWVGGCARTFEATEALRPFINQCDMVEVARFIQKKC